MKNKNLLYLPLILFLAGGWFYWTQIREPNIRNKCYTSAFRKNEFNGEWAEGKVWNSGYNKWLYSPFPSSYEWESGKLVKKDAMAKHKENRNIVYEKCLIKNNISK